jgi:hypothetical protein
MRTSRYLTVLSILLLGLAIPAAAQRTRRPAPKPTPKPTPTPARQTVSPVVTAAKQLVANQLHNVRIFVDKMGPIAVAIENLDREAAARRLRNDQIDANETNKQKMIAAIRGLRDGLQSLETEFRTKPQLGQYLPRIEGISALCSQSEDQAIAGRFVAAKEPLRQITVKLSDTMALLPGGTVTSPTATSAAPQSRPVPAANQTRPAVTQTVSNTKREVSIGMTTAEVQASSWGSPVDKRTSSTQNGTTEVWIYGGSRTVYFFNGKVTRIVQ